MTAITEIIKTVAPVILILAIGMLCRSKKLLSVEGIAALKNVVINITLPAVMLNAFATMEYTVKNIIITVLIFLSCGLALVLGGLIKKALRGNLKFLPFITTGFEAGMLGYALFIMLYGNNRISEFASVDLGQVLFVFTVYKVLLSIGSGEKPKAKKVLLDMATSPIMIAIGVGLIMGATGLYTALIPSGVSSVIDACTQFISAPTSAIILIVIGYELVPRDINWRSAFLSVGSRIAVMAVCRVILGIALKLMGINGLSDALNVLFILPPPYVLSVFAENENQKSDVSAVLSLSTLTTIIGFIVLAVIR